MKKLLLLLLLGPLFTQARVIPESPDTVKLIDGAERLTVSRTGDTTLIEVEMKDNDVTDIFSYQVTVGEDDDSESYFDFDIPFGIGNKRENKPHSSGRRKLRTSAFGLGNIYLGQRFNYSDKGHVKNSIEFGVRNIIGLRWSRGGCFPSFSIGIGVGGMHYRAQEGFMYVSDGSCLMLVPVEEGCKVRSTGLSVCSFQIPLLFTVPMGSMEFSAGAVGCFNTYAKAHTELEIGNYRYKTTVKGLQQRLFTADLTCALGLCDILGVYVSWSPMTLFQYPFGPELKSWSIGGVINF